MAKSAEMKYFRGERYQSGKLSFGKNLFVVTGGRCRGEELFLTVGFALLR